MKKRQTKNQRKQKQKQKQRQNRPMKRFEKINWKKVWTWLIPILLITFLAYLPALDGEFTNWDDNDYITDNLKIRHLDVETVKDIFSSYLMGNYHPITVLSFTIDYHFVKYEPFWYHLHNVLLHLMTTALVFFFIFKLVNFNSRAPNYWIPLITALLFGVNAMHVESVAWTVERKDLLYTLFFLLSLISYLNFLRKRSALYFVLALVLFVLSLTSKAQAVTLAVVLVAIDFLLNRKLLSKQVILEKIPFFVLSFIFGIIAIKAQQASEAISDITQYPFHERIVFAAYGFTQYLLKLTVPVQLSAFYPYLMGPNQQLPAVYWLYLLPALGVAYLAFTSVKKNKRLAFGIWFFIVNVFLVLQLLPVGNAIMADRYSYVPSIGFFFLIALGVNHLIIKKKQQQNLLLAGVGVYALLLSVLTYNRCGDWHDSMTLWNDVIEKHDNIPVAWNNRGILKKNSNDLEGAIEDYNRALKIDPNYSLAYVNRGNANRRLGKYKESIADFDKAIQLKPENSMAYSNRGIAKANIGKSEEAKKDFDKAIELKPDYGDAYSNRGGILISMKRYEDAIKDLNKSLNINPLAPDPYTNRGIAKSQLKDYEGAIKDFNTVIGMQPQNTDAFLNRAFTYANKGDYQLAISDFNTVIQQRPNSGIAYFYRGISKEKMGKKDEACKDYHLADKYNFAAAKAQIAYSCK